jgi:transcription initiation factor TFIIB
MPKSRTTDVKDSRYIAWFSSADASEKRGIEDLAFIIVKTARELDVVRRKGPAGVASAACYIASMLLGEEIPTRKIAELAGVREDTIKARYKDLIKHLLFTIIL